MYGKINKIGSQSPSFVGCRKNEEPEQRRTALSCGEDHAHMYAFAGDKDNAMEWLEKAYEMRDPMMPYVGAPIFDLLDDDPRCQDLLRRMNLPVGQ